MSLTVLCGEFVSHGVILEDDAILHDDFSEVIAALPTIGWRWDIVRLSAFTVNRDIAKGKYGVNDYKSRRLWHRVNRKLRAIGRGRFLVRYKRPVFDTAGYVVTREAAQVLLRHCNAIKEPIDLMYEKWWETGMHFFGVHLPVVGQMRQESTESADDSIIEAERDERMKKMLNSPDAKRLKALERKKERRDKWRCYLWNLRHPPEKI